MLRRASGRVALAAIVAAVLVLSAAAAAASAANRVYWSNSASNTIGFAGLDGGASGVLDTSGLALSSPNGTAVDLEGGRIYWANTGSDTIGWAPLGGTVGTGGGTLATGGATVDDPVGVVYDAINERVWWANSGVADGGAGAIAFAEVSGGSAGDVDTTGASVASPRGLAVDPIGGAVYWANLGGSGSLSYALTGSGESGAGDLYTSASPGVTVASPTGVALDRASGRLHWTNSAPASVAYANADGSGAGGAIPLGATPGTPRGIALDPAAGLAHWAEGPAISRAPLDGSAAGVDLAAPASGASYPSLVKAPANAGVPFIVGATTTFSTIFCGQGGWAMDEPASGLYRRHLGIGFRWFRDGVLVPGETGKSLVVYTVGRYACEVTASNQVGATAAFAVPRLMHEPYDAPTVEAPAAKKRKPTTKRRCTKKAKRRGARKCARRKQPKRR